MPDTVTNAPQRSNPDPSPLTTAQLQREVMNLRELMQANSEIITVRLDGMDKAVELLQKYPTEVDRAVVRLQQLHEEKFSSVEKQFSSNRTALDAALAAAREAAAKTEMNTTKQIDSLIALINTKNAASDDKIDDIRNRVTVVESVKKGAGENLGAIFGGIAAVAAIASVISVIMLLITKP